MEEGSGCEKCKTWEEEMYWKHFNSVHFCQILSKDFHDHLVLPVKFAENMVCKLPDKVSLIGPSGTAWDVELKKADNIFFVGDGWKAFVEAYDLEENCLLMFKYTQNFGFEVLIFNSDFNSDSFCEKEAAYFVKRCSHTKSDDDNGKKSLVREAFSTEVIEDKNEEEIDHNSEFVASERARKDAEELVCLGHENNSQTPRKNLSEVVTDGNKGRGKPRKRVVPLKPPSKLKAQSAKKLKRNEAAEEQNSPENGGSTLETVHSEKTSETRGRRKKQVASKSSRKLVFQRDSAKKRYSNEYISNRRPVTEIEKQNAQQMACKEMTGKSFIALMRPTCVYKRFYLSIPAEWMNKHMPLRQQEVILRVGEKTWRTTFYYNNRKGGGLSSVGWKKFALDNFLEEFDVCLFKLVSQQDDPALVFDVDIFRVIPEIVPPSPVVSSLA